MFPQNFINSRVEEIFHWYITGFQGPSGLPVSYIDGLKGNVVNSEVLVADFGDYVPLFAYFEKYPEVVGYCCKQFTLVNAYVKKTNLEKKFFGVSLIHAFDFSDVLFGYYLYYLLKPTVEVRQAALSVLEKVVGIFFSGTGTSFYLPQFDWKLPLINSLLGGLMEPLVLWSEYLDKENQWLEKATQLAITLATDDFFQHYGLFPHHLIRKHRWFLKYLPFLKQNLVTMMKNNTAIVWGLLEIYKKTGNQEIKDWLTLWLESLDKAMTSEGYVGQEITFEKGKQRITLVTLAANFAVLDLLCDLAYFLGSERPLVIAEKIGNAWLKLQNTHTGLLPFYPKVEESFLDSETDMVIAWLKIAELSSKSQYKEAAQKLADGIFKYHRRNFGYVLSANIKTGKIVNQIVNVKFNALLLKLLIYSQEKDKIYDNKLLFELLKDR